MQRMSTDLRHEIISTSSEQTEQLGRLIGANMKGGETIQLVSDLGGGKTTLTKGFVAGIGCEAMVSSPTFTISKEYKGTRVALKHFDFYRLTDAGIMQHELQEDIKDTSSVVVIEWADIIRSVLPEDTITITLRFVNEHDRKIIISAPQLRHYILKGLE